ncbi:MAG: DUF1800 family protein [Saprospiraceae bacterium]|nr:DUF1800 family protein [Saprospiraceae bacterium]
MASLNPLQGTLGHRRAAHLLRRTSFRFTKSRVDSLAAQTVNQAVASILQLYPLQRDQPVYDNPNDLTTHENGVWCLPPGQPLPPSMTGILDFQLRPFITSWWMHEALFDQGISHKMALFLHQFNQATLNSFGNTHFFDYLQLMRWGSLGNFRAFSFKVIADNVMLRYLNNQQNTANNPNENFAREFLELFTIGKGPQVAPGDYTNYTEDDIIAAAKVLTGVRTQIQRTQIDPDTGIPTGVYTPGQHNWTEKKFSARFQDLTIPAVTVPAQRTAAKMVEELNMFVNKVFEQSETAKNLCRRLYRYFVSPKITDEIENDVIVPLSNTLVAANWEIKPVLQQLFRSEHFFDADDSDNKNEIVGGIIKSPLDLMFQAHSFFNMPVPDPNATADRLHLMYTRLGFLTTGAGMNLFFASDVAGYPGFYQHPDYSRAWFNSSSIITRYRVPFNYLTGKLNPDGGNGLGNQLFTRLDIAAWTKNSGFVTDPSDAWLLVREFLLYLLPEEVDDQRFEYFYTNVFLDGLPADDWTYEWQTYVQTGNDAEVRTILERFLKAVMYSPEYQTF